MKSQNVMPISAIRELQKVNDKARIAQLEAELAAAKEENLMIMEATAEVYEMVITLQNGGTA